MKTDSSLTTDPRITNEDLGEAIRELAHFHKLNYIFNLAAVYAANRKTGQHQTLNQEKDILQ